LAGRQYTAGTVEKENSDQRGERRKKKKWRKQIKKEDMVGWHSKG